MNLFRTKPIMPQSTQSSLRRCLNATDLTLMGIGAIIGAGVFVLTGVAAATKAGPAISLSYVIAGLASLFSALAYAELAASVGGCGSAYNYSYASFGELVAWMIGWALILEYTIAVSTVAIGWSGYVNDALQTMHIHMPKKLIMNPAEGGWVNLPALLVVGFMSIMLCIGVKQSARFNSVVVMIKLVAIAIFIGVAVGNIHTQNWHPFFPFGWQGVAQGGALVFFAYVGFDAVSTAAEEAINPQRNLPIGIISSVVICTIIYVIIGVLLTGISHYSTLNVSSPVSNALLNIGYPIAASLISVGAIAGLTTVMLVMFYGVTRISFAMSRDGLLPPFFAKVHPRTKTPIPLIIITGIIIALVAGFVPLSEAASLVNIGTLSAFTLVCCGVVAMRIMHPELPRPFKLPLNPITPFLGIIFCLYLMINLSAITWTCFLLWLAIGIVVYFSYSQRNSVLGKQKP